MKIAHGIFTWCSDERRSDRYGAFLLGDSPYAGPDRVTPTYDLASAAALVGKRVRITVKVVESRKSGHVGDLFLDIKPSQPEVGEVIDLGVGILGQEAVSWTPSPTILLKPNDGRERFWIDPRKLYRLHDQTVDVFVEETTDDFSPVPDVENKKAPDMILSNGDGESIQAKVVKLSSRTRLKHKVERIGDGMFILSPPTAAPEGEAIEYTQEGSPTIFERISEDEG